MVRRLFTLLVLASTLLASGCLHGRIAHRRAMRLGCCSPCASVPTGCCDIGPLR